ncbi:uncharacterized protein LOC128384063, partial [Scomber scombrus]
TKRSCWDETEGGGKNYFSKSDDTEEQPLNAARSDGANLTVNPAMSEENKELKLEGWKLRVTVNDQNPIMFTFKESIILKAEEKVNDLKLEGWKLRVTVNDENSIMFTFEESFILRAEEKVYIWVPGFVTHFPPYNLVWKELKRWAKGDKLLVELINCHEEIVKTTEVK